jgi:hypothetical protein
MGRPAATDLINVFILARFLVVAFTTGIIDQRYRERETSFHSLG